MRDPEDILLVTWFENNIISACVDIKQYLAKFSEMIHILFSRKMYKQ